VRDKYSTGVVNAFFTSLGTAATPLPRTYNSLVPPAVTLKAKGPWCNTGD